MPCKHLTELFELCEKHDLQIAGPDAIRVICRQCEEQEVCPTSLTDGDQVLVPIRAPEAKSLSDPKTSSDASSS
ncbi:hypothetical protein [Stieleria varia]|nr:hypothetical protein [Stieleria varia]